MFFGLVLKFLWIKCKFVPENNNQKEFSQTLDFESLEIKAFGFILYLNLIVI